MALVATLDLEIGRRILVVHRAQLRASILGCCAITNCDGVEAIYKIRRIQGMEFIDVTLQSSLGTWIGAWTFFSRISDPIALTKAASPIGPFHPVVTTCRGPSPIYPTIIRPGSIFNFTPINAALSPTPPRCARRPIAPNRNHVDPFANV